MCFYVYVMEVSCSSKNQNQKEMHTGLEQHEGCNNLGQLSLV